MPRDTGPYRLRRCLGIGGQGQVWRAKGPDGVVALKLAERPAERIRLLAEAELLATLDHPAIVRRRAHDPGGHWMAMELLSGRALDVWAKDRSLAERVEVLARIIEAVAYLHACDIVHGDLKPQNILVDDDGRPRLIDLSPDIGGGSLGYAAPEQLIGEGVGRASDTYALGCLGYQLLTDQPPFSASDRAALLWMPVNTLPLPPSALAPGIPHKLEQAVLGCLARTPSARPADLGALARDLRSGLQSPTTRPVLGMFAVRRLLRRRLVEAMEGGCPVLTVLGAPRSGRSTLIEEVLDAAAREGVAILRPSREAPASILPRLSEGPFALRLEAGDAITEPLCEAIQAQKLSGLTLVRAADPLPGLPREGFVRPSKLSEEDIANMLEIAGQFPGFAPDVLRITRGHPGVVRDYILRRGLPTDLDARQRSLLSAVTTGPRSLFVLALRLGVSEHDLLDVAETLLERGLLEERDGGRALAAVLPRPLKR